ncbi:MAG: hypothetical protein WKG32_07700 [Gemmatimonadaceae bacterium]
MTSPPRFAPVIVLAATLLAAPALAHAQMLGTPVLQNAWANPGITVAANVASGDGTRTYGGAGAWAPSSMRFQVSAGAGLLDPETELADNTVTFGARAMAPLPLLNREGALGVAAFAGVGGASSDGVSYLSIPFGVALGYRRALGATRGVSAYVAPFYAITRASADSASASGNLFRVSGGVDVTLFGSLGLTLGYEGGATAAEGDPGPTGGVFGVGVSYALRRPR